MSNKLVWIGGGAISLVGGLVALIYPLAATLTVELIAGWIFLFAGIMQLFSVFRDQNWRARLWAGLAGIAFTLVGVALLTNPLAGIVTLTLTVAILFLISGIGKTLLSFSMRGSAYFWPVLISGLVSVALAIMIFSNFPKSAAIILGVLLAVELISGGVAMIAIGMARGENGHDNTKA